MMKGGEKPELRVVDRVFLILYLVLFVTCALMIVMDVNFVSEVLFGSYSDGRVDGFWHDLYFSLPNLVALLVIWLVAVVIMILPQNQLKHKIVWSIGLIAFSLLFVLVGKIRETGGLAGKTYVRGVGVIDFYKEKSSGTWKKGRDAISRLPSGPDVVDPRDY